MHTIRENALAFVAGRPVAEIVQASEEIYDELMADRIWAGTRALAQQHLDAGQRVWLVTATPVELACDHRPPAGAHRRARHGRRGRRRQVHRPAGRRADARRRRRPRRCWRSPSGRASTSSRCTAYSDSANDLPMLSLTGTAVAVNPDTELRAVARSRGWTDPRLPHRPQGREDRRPDGRARAALSGGVVGGAIALRRRDKLPW